MRNTIAATTMALGIGASTAIFSFVNPLLLHPFTYPQPDRLVMVEEREANHNRTLGLVSYPAFCDWSSQTKTFAGIGAFDIGFFFLTGVEEPEQIAGALVTSALFRTLGVAPAIGRDFREGEEDVVILTDACWKRRFGGDPNILGKSVALDFARTPKVERYTVVGVMSPKFWMYYSGFEVFVPLARSAIREDRKARGLIAIGRLAEGVTVDQGQAALAAIPDEKDWNVTIRPWERAVTAPLRSELLVLAGGAALLLLIASANVAGLLLVRAQARRREIAIRAALGARPWTLAAIFIRESLALGLPATALGVVMAWWGVRAILALRPADLYVMQLSPGLDRIAVDRNALLFAAGAALLSCLLAGIFPAFEARKVNVMNGLKDAGSVQSARGRRMLVAAEVALSVMLLAGAGLLIKTLEQIHAVDLGFLPDHVLAMRLPVPQGQAADHDRTAAYFRDVLARVAALQGVRAAALSEQLPLSGTGDVLPTSGRGPGAFEIPGSAEPVRVRQVVVSPSYFQTLRIPLISGRYLTETDQHRMVISASMARRWWPTENPVGKTLYQQTQNLEIVGVVADSQRMQVNAGGIRLYDGGDLAVYTPLRDGPPAAQYRLAVRTASNPLSLAPAVRGVVRDLGGVIAEMDTMERGIEDATWQNQQAAELVTTFAALALLLSGVGLYGVISQAVSRRTREIGVRVTLGARRPNVITMVIGESITPVICGIVVGLGAALGLRRTVASLLYHVSPSDPWVLAGVAIAMATAALVACCVPIWRARRIDAATALRSE